MRPQPPGEEQDLLPPSIRRPAAVLAGCAALVFLVLAVKYRAADTYGGFDRWIQERLPGREALPMRTLWGVAELVPPVLVLVVVGLTVACLVLRRWRLAAFAALGPGASMLVAEVGKVVVGRRLEGFLVLPSGHTAGVTTVSLVVALLLLRLGRRYLVALFALLLVAVTVLAGAIAFVMVALRFHYATDTVAGFGAAVATTLGVAFLIDANARRRAARRYALAAPAPELDVSRGRAG